MSQTTWQNPILLHNLPIDPTYEKTFPLLIEVGGTALPHRLFLQPTEDLYIGNTFWDSVHSY